MQSRVAHRNAAASIHRRIIHSIIEIHVAIASVSIERHSIRDDRRHRNCIRMVAVRRIVRRTRIAITTIGRRIEVAGQ
jgi:hypothetical protein